MPAMLNSIADHPLLFLAALALLGLFGFLLSRDSGYRYEAKPLLTANELNFYGTLVEALAGYAVFPQVAMNAFIRPAGGLERKRYAATRGTFAQKHVDFLVCEPDTLEVLAIIELDDRSHSLEKDNARDAITAAAGYRTLRFHSRNKPDIEDIRSIFADLLAAKPGARIIAY